VLHSIGILQPCGFKLLDLQSICRLLWQRHHPPHFLLFLMTWLYWVVDLRWRSACPTTMYVCVATKSGFLLNEETASPVICSFCGASMASNGPLHSIDGGTKHITQNSPSIDRWLEQDANQEPWHGMLLNTEQQERDRKTGGNSATFVLKAGL
jgi:hypothetical protein